MRLWTWQAPEVAHALSSGQAHQPQWERVPQAGHPAYRAMTHAMVDAGLAVADHPPIWLWCDEPDAETVADRAFQVVREADEERGLLVLTIEAPDSSMLLTSYSGWLERLADPTSRRVFDPAPGLGPTDLQACLPVLQPDWVTDCRPLPADAFALATDGTAQTG